MLGYIDQNPVFSIPVQRFENIGNQVLQLNQQNIPASNYYFLHPALCNYIQENRKNANLRFQPNPYLIIGDGKQFALEKRRRIASYVGRCREQIKKERVFISSTIYDLRKDRNIIRKCILSKKLVPVMSETPEFDLQKSPDVHSHDLCLDELIKCHSLKFIIGKEYGGIYAGEKYQDCVKEIADNSNGKITSPSISLMEYYVARRKRIKCFAFVSESVADRIIKKKIRHWISELLWSTTSLTIFLMVMQYVEIGFQFIKVITIYLLELSAFGFS